MEGPDLRALWQRAPREAAPPFDAHALNTLLAQRSRGILERMRRNAWIEVAINAFAVVALPFLINRTESRVLQIAFVLLLIVCLGFFYYYNRKLRILRRLNQQDASSDVRGHLHTLVRELRRLLRIYERQSVLIFPVFLLIGLIAGALEGNPNGAARLASWRAWPLYAVFVGLAVPLTLLQLWGVRWYLRQLYGQHLDRLEGYLREMDES